jgi:hypothetical protein
VNESDPTGLCFICPVWENTGVKVVHAFATHPKVVFGIAPEVSPRSQLDEDIRSHRV